MKMNFTLEGMITGVGLALAASVLLPVVKNAARPLTAAGIQGINLVGNQVKSGLGYLREEVEDLVAEAQFERFKQSMDEEIQS